MERTISINRRFSRLQHRRHFQKEAKNYAFKKTLLKVVMYCFSLCFLLIFRDFVKICNSSVDGFTQHFSYFFVAPLIDVYVSDTGVKAKYIVIICSTYFIFLEQQRKMAAKTS